MTNPRIEVLAAWQDAALIERKALADAYEHIVELCDQRDAGEYPRLKALSEALADVDKSISERELRLEELDRANAVKFPTRLASLLHEQEAAHRERAALVAERRVIEIEADDKGQTDFDDEQDRRYRALTRAIAEVDREIADRDTEIETAAALSGTGV